jgi:menaquinone-9 beta-reductase
MTTAQAMVIGGGIAGAAAATHLARAGRAVVLLERKAIPCDKVCGEFVSDEAARYLHDLDIDLDRLGAVRICSVRLYAQNTSVSTSLPFTAFSLSRRVLDEAVLRRAEASSAEVRRGRAVRSLQPHNGDWVAELNDGSKVSAPDVFLATGKHDLRGWKREPSRRGEHVAFKLHWFLNAAQAATLGSCVDLFVFRGGYAGLELVENAFANFCLVIRQCYFARFDYRWDLLLSSLRSDFPALDQRLSGALPRWDRPLAIASIPYGFVQSLGKGPWCLGDQAAVIPSFSGDGIAIALHSARLAAEFYLSGGTSSQFQSRLARDISGQVRRAMLISRLIVHPAGQAIAIAVARLAPMVVGYVACRTRIPRRRLIDGGRSRHVFQQLADVPRSGS